MVYNYSINESSKKKMDFKKNNIYSLAVLHDLFAHMAILKQLEHNKCTINLRQHQTLQNARCSLPKERQFFSCLQYHESAAHPGRNEVLWVYMCFLEVLRRKYSTVWPATLLVSQAVKVFCYSVVLHRRCLVCLLM